VLVLSQAGVIMAVDASILAIPNIGSQVTTRTLCSLSLILSVHCIFAGVVAQHFGQKMKSLQFAVRSSSIDYSCGYFLTRTF
jgi:hypothetical protein